MSTRHPSRGSMHEPDCFGSASTKKILLFLLVLLSPFQKITFFVRGQASGSTIVTIPLDETCTIALITTDTNFDSNLDINEYFAFTKELRPECLANVPELPLELRLAFLQLSCDCSSRQSDSGNGGGGDGASLSVDNSATNNSDTEEIIQEVQTCCVDQDPMIPTIGASVVDDATIADYLYIQQVRNFDSLFVDFRLPFRFARRIYPY